MSADLANAIHAIFMHPNGAPFIGNQLIHKLVTSNPSPAYVARTASVFNDNGAGLRGDLEAVVPTILLDPEARSPHPDDSMYGRLRDPAQFIVALARALNATTDGVFFRALKAFYDATSALGVANQVTTFTLSDFGRTFQLAAGGGTDHAWGNHHFIMGGALQGGRLYGEYPQLVLGCPSDAEKEGRWMPTTAVDQYGATLANWFGANATELAAVFPNLGRIAPCDLGFLG